jgi:hypothetical protein
VELDAAVDTESLVGWSTSSQSSSQVRSSQSNDVSKLPCVGSTPAVARVPLILRSSSVSSVEDFSVAVWLLTDVDAALWPVSGGKDAVSRVLSVSYSTTASSRL